MASQSFPSSRFLQLACLLVACHVLTVHGVDRRRLPSRPVTLVPSGYLKISPVIPLEDGEDTIQRHRGRILVDSDDMLPMPVGESNTGERSSGFKDSQAERSQNLESTQQSSSTQSPSSSSTEGLRGRSRSRTGKAILPFDITPKRRRRRRSRRANSAAAVSGTQSSSELGQAIPTAMMNDKQVTITPMSWTNDTLEAVTYHDGPVLVNPINLYVIFYGVWPRLSILSIFNFLNSLSGSYVVPEGWNNVRDWWQLTAKYTQADGKPVSSLVGVKQAMYDPTYQSGPGQTLSDYRQDIVSIINYYLRNHMLPFDPDAVYIVLTDPTVDVTSPDPNDGFCRRFCGYHSFGHGADGSEAKFAFVGHASRCPAKCIRRIDYPSVNGVDVDSIISSLGHELSEAANDPTFKSWYDSNSTEAADKCSFLFGDGHLTLSGAAYNMVGKRNSKFLVQAMWDNDKRECTFTPSS